MGGFHQADERLAAALEAAKDEFTSQQIETAEQLTKDLQDKNERKTKAWEAMIQEMHTGEVQALKAILAHERQGHAAILDNLVVSHEQTCADMRQQAHHDSVLLSQQHEDTVAALMQEHRQSSQAAAAAYDAHLQSTLAQANTFVFYVSAASSFCPHAWT